MNAIHNIYQAQLSGCIAPTGVKLPARKQLEIRLEVLERMIAQGIDRADEAAEIRKALAIADAEGERLERASAVRAALFDLRTQDLMQGTELLSETRREFLDRARNLREQMDAADLGESPWETRRNVGV